MKDNNNKRDIARSIELTSNDITLSKGEDYRTDSIYFIKDKSTGAKYEIMNDIFPIRNVSQIKILREVKPKEVVVVTYDENNNKSDLSHVIFNEEGAKEVEHIDWDTVKPEEYMTNPKENDKSLFVGEHTYLIHRSNCDILYNPFNRGLVKADEFSKIDDDGELLGSIYLSDEGVFEKTDFLVDVDTLQTDMFYSDLRKECIPIYPDKLFKNMASYKKLDEFGRYKYRFDKTYEYEIKKHFEDESKKHRRRLERNKPEIVKTLRLEKNNKKSDKNNK